MWEPIWDLSYDAGFQTPGSHHHNSNFFSAPPPAAQFPPCMDAHDEDGFMALYIHTHMQTLEAGHLFRSTHW